MAYLTAKDGEPPKDSELRDLLRAKLPEYMVPSSFVTMDRLPMTPNGKVNRKALPQPATSPDPAGFVAPKTPTEALAASGNNLLGWIAGGAKRQLL